MNKTYYIAVNGQRTGPFTFNELENKKALTRKNKLKDMVGTTTHHLFQQPVILHSFELQASYMCSSPRKFLGNSPTESFLSPLGS